MHLLPSETLKLSQTSRSVLEPVTLQGTHILLEPIDSDRDSEALFLAANGSGPSGEAGAYDPDREIWQYMFGGPYPTLASFKTYVAGLQNMKDGLGYCVVDRASGQRIGVVTYCSVVASQLRLEVGGIWYNPRFQRTFANTESILLLLGHAFETLGYRRVEWKCDNNNERSKKAAVRLGFEYEGLFRQHMIIKGLNRDTAWFSAIDSDWPKMKAGLIARLEKHT